MTVYLNGKSGVNATTYQRLYSFYKLNGSCLRGGGFGKQLVKGSPVYPSGQVHTGVWLMTVHWAPAPHDPGHGSRHLSLMHALLLGHSELMLHSGRQFGGTPM